MDITSFILGRASASDEGGGGGSSLPDVTAADNGDVLTVVNGAWDKAAPSGGPFEIITTTGTYDIYTGESTIQAVNANAVPNALAAGKIPLLYITITTTYESTPFTYLNAYPYTTTYYSPSGGQLVVSSYNFSEYYTVFPDGTVTEN